MNTILTETGLPALRGTRSPNHIGYRRVRENVAELLSTPDTDEWTGVPACPDWTIRDLLSHLVGAATLRIGRLSGRSPAGRTPSHSMDLSGLLDEWATLGQHTERLIAERGGRTGSVLLMDAFTHELDFRYALGVPLPAEHPAFTRAFEVLATGFANSVVAHHLPAVRLSTGSTQWTMGDGEPVATLTADRYDLYRSLAGRRTHEQIAALGWDRGSHRWLPAFTWGPFTPPGSPVEQAS